MSNTPWTIIGLATARADLLERGTIYISVEGSVSENIAKVGELRKYLRASNIEARWSALGSDMIRVEMIPEKKAPPRASHKGGRASAPDIERYKRLRDRALNG